MSFAATLVQFSFPMLTLAGLVRGAFTLALLASLLMFFRPLLGGILRALVLALRPRAGRVRAARPPAGGALPRQGA